MALERSQQGLQVWLKPRPDPRLWREVMAIQSRGTPTLDSFRTPTWESREKQPFGCSPRGESQRIL